MRTTIRQTLCLLITILLPGVSLANDLEKLSSQNEYLISQVVELRKKVKEYEAGEKLLLKQLEKERQRANEESANVQALSQQVVELKTETKKMVSGKNEAELQQRQLSESQARLSAEVSRLTLLADDLTKQLQQKTESQSQQETSSKEKGEELDSLKRSHSKVTSDLGQCLADKQAATDNIARLNEQLKSTQSSLSTITDKDREIARLKNEVLLKDSLLNSLGSKTAPQVQQPAANAGTQKPSPARISQENRDELFKRSGEAAGIETTGRKKINVPTGKGGDAVQLPIDTMNPPSSDMESFGSIPNKGSSSRGTTVDRAFEKLKGDLERQRSAGEVTPGIQ